MNNTAIVTMTNTVNTPVSGYNTMTGKYCSYKSFYGAVINALENDEVSTEYINERHYFRALEKLKIVTRGNLSIKDGEAEVTRNKMGQLYPPNASIQKVFDNEADGVYRKKRDTYGFNCENAEDMTTMVLNPTVELLTIVSNDMEVAIEKLEGNKEGVKALGMNLGDAKKITADRIINKYL